MCVDPRAAVAGGFSIPLLSPSSPRSSGSLVCLPRPRPPRLSLAYHRPRSPLSLASPALPPRSLGARPRGGRHSPGNVPLRGGGGVATLDTGGGVWARVEWRDARPATFMIVEVRFLADLRRRAGACRVRRRPFGAPTLPLPAPPVPPHRSIPFPPPSKHAPPLPLGTPALAPLPPSPSRHLPRRPPPPLPRRPIPPPPPMPSPPPPLSTAPPSDQLPLLPPPPPPPTCDTVVMRKKYSIVS